MPAAPTICITYYVFSQISLVLIPSASLCFLYVFPIMGACCAQIKGFTLGCRELVLVRPNVKPFI